MCRRTVQLFAPSPTTSPAASETVRTGAPGVDVTRCSFQRFPLTCAGLTTLTGSGVEDHPFGRLAVSPVRGPVTVAGRPLDDSQGRRAAVLEVRGQPRAQPGISGTRPTPRDLDTDSRLI